MANGNQRRDIRKLLRDKDFLNQNLQSFGMDQNTLPLGSAGALRRVVGGGLLNSPGRVGATSGTSVGFPRNAGSSRRVIEGETLPNNRKALPAPGNNKLGHLLTLLTMGGYGAYNLMKGNQDTPVAVAGESPPVDPGVNGSGGGGNVVSPPADTWTPGGLQTGLDFISDRRRFYFDTLSGATGQAAILNLMEKGAGDKFLKQIGEDIEDQEEFKDDEYIAKINKAVFSKPYKNARELFDRLVKAEIPVDIAAQITGHVPKTKMVNFINPDTDETYSADEGSVPEPGFRRVDSTLDKTYSGKNSERERVLSRAVELGGEAGAEYLARWLVTAKGADYSYKEAIAEAREMLKTSAGGGAPKTREEAFAILKNDPAWGDKTDEEINAALDARWGS